MNEKPEQENQELNKLEGIHKTDVGKSDAEVKNVIVELEEDNVDVLAELKEKTDPVVDETVMKEVIEESPIVIQDYLDPSILDVKAISEAEFKQYEEKSDTSDNLSDQ